MIRPSLKSSLVWIPHKKCFFLLERMHKNKKEKVGWRSKTLIYHLLGARKKCLNHAWGLFIWCGVHDMLITLGCAMMDIYAEDSLLMGIARPCLDAYVAHFLRALETLTAQWSSSNILTPKMSLESMFRRKITITSELLSLWVSSSPITCLWSTDESVRTN